MKRFKIAFSITGEHRGFVVKVAELLAGMFGETKIITIITIRPNSPKWTLKFSRVLLGAHYLVPLRVTHCHEIRHNFERVTVIGMEHGIALASDLRRRP